MILGTLSLTSKELMSQWECQERIRKRKMSGGMVEDRLGLGKVLYGDLK
jgi:hypothetical protein